MYCSNCGTQNMETANFCRACGRNFQNLSTRRLLDMRNPEQDRAFKRLFVGIMLLLISSALPSFTRPLSLCLSIIGIVLLIKGVRLFAFSRFAASSPDSQTATTPFHRIQETSSQQIQTPVQVKSTGELVPPPSVTENTTKLFDRQ
jgi:uncharacterized membrane protein YvbJ